MVYNLNKTYEESEEKQMKKIISLICILALLFPLCSYNTKALSFGDAGVLFIAENKTVTAGSAVDYKLSIELNDSISIGGMMFKLNFDSLSFYIDSVTLGADFSAAEVSTNNDYGVVTFLWESDLAIRASTDVLTVKLITYSDSYLGTQKPSIGNLELYDDSLEMNDILALTEDIGDITVTDQKVLTGIALNTQPVKKTYEVGSEFDSTGLSIKLFFSDNSSDNMSEGYIPIYDFSTIGAREVVIFYDGYKTVPIVVTVTLAVITSSVYSVSSGYVGKIAKGTTVGTFVNSLNEKNYIQLFKNSIQALSTDIVSTGMDIKLIANGAVIHTYVAVVTGDVSGDGEINVIDLVMVKALLLGKRTVSAAASKAADTDSDKRISLTDYARIKSFLLGKGFITPQAID